MQLLELDLHKPAKTFHRDQPSHLPTITASPQRVCTACPLPPLPLGEVAHAVARALQFRMRAPFPPRAACHQDHLVPSLEAAHRNREHTVGHMMSGMGAVRAIVGLQHAVEAGARAAMIEMRGAGAEVQAAAGVGVGAGQGPELEPGALLSEAQRYYIFSSLPFFRFELAFLTNGR